MVLKKDYVLASKADKPGLCEGIAGFSDAALAYNFSGITLGHCVRMTRLRAGFSDPLREPALAVLQF